MTFDWTIKVTDIAIVFATILGPVLAVQAQKWLERDREIKQRRAWLFRTLMSTRATNLSPAHVEALNAIPIEFYGSDRRLKAIIDKWKLYLDHLGKDPRPHEWGTRRVELMVSLLHEMATYLGYEFNTVEIANEIYSPTAHANIETDQEIIRRGLAKLLSGDLALPMDVRSFPQDPQVLKAHLDLQQALTSAIDRGSLRVVVENKPLA